MYEILSRLDERAIVLDLGSGAGSFPASATRARVLRLDAERPAAPPANFVLAGAAHLPLPAASIDAVISNHSFEHIAGPEAAAREIARVLRPGGWIYIAVPDASTPADRLYRWLGRGGGHINAFTDPSHLPRLFASLEAPPLACVRTLHSSLSFLNRANHRARAPRRLLLVGNGSERFLRVLTWMLRLADLRFGTRLGVYGWAYYFGEFPEGAPSTSAAVNVCIRCGSGHASAWLEAQGLVRRRASGPPRYACPACGAPNFFTRERAPREPSPAAPQDT